MHVIGDLLFIKFAVRKKRSVNSGTLMVKNTCLHWGFLLHHYLMLLS